MLFQLCSENVTLMMTPRGVADVHVYTPERVEARYGVRPDRFRFHRPQGRYLRQHHIAGIGDKTAGH